MTLSPKAIQKEEEKGRKLLVEIRAHRIASAESASRTISEMYDIATDVEKFQVRKKIDKINRAGKILETDMKKLVADLEKVSK